MKITLIFTGKTQSAEIRSICEDYKARIKHYVKLEEFIVEPNAKSSATVQAKQKEGELILKKIAPGDFVILLDENGKEFGSVAFANYMGSLFNQSLKNICFIVGGAYGFSNALYQRANAKISLSKMTFSHQIVRAIFMEQLYRAFTIINGGEIPSLNAEFGIGNFAIHHSTSRVPYLNFAFYIFPSSAED